MNEMSQQREWWVNFEQNKVKNVLTVNKNIAENVQLSVSEHIQEKLTSYF
jgi:hypothetical protein